MSEITTKGYENLANAVVEMAAEDYRKALVKEHELEIKLSKARGSRLSLEKFFTGSEIQLYTKLDGTQLMNRLKEQVIEHDYDLKKLKESQQLKQKESTGES